MIIDRTEDFFKAFHPQGKTCGSIILERKFAKGLKRSRISSFDLEQLSSKACGLDDIFFSTASFNGRPLLLNFARTTCLHLQIPEVDSRTYLDLTLRLSNIKDVPLPTLTLSDGELLTLLWMLDTPITTREFHTYNILQNIIYELASEFNPTENNLDISFLTRVVGSVNSKNKQNVRIIRHHGKIHNLQHIKEKLLSLTVSITASKFQQLQNQAGVTLELLSLFGSRWFSNSQSPELFSDWIIFFGASLCNFCTPKQLEIELKALAESLEAKPWNIISTEYRELISTIATTAKNGYITFDGFSHAINHPTWNELIQGKLNITSDEIKSLNLKTLSGISPISPYLHDDLTYLYAVGANDFIPYQRLLLQKAS